MPKSASGRTPLEDEGASAIHSAELLAAFDTVLVVVKVHDLLESAMVTLNTLLPSYVTLAEIESPGATVAATDPPVEVEVAWVISYMLAG